MSTWKSRARPLAFAAVALCLGLFAVRFAHAVPASPELQKQVRAAAFEVVLRKPEQDRLTYEKPLPLELLPFTERTDKYWSVGTAFAIGANLFVSAGHVLQQGVGSQFGAPSLRDAQGKVYPIDRIVKYSVHEDFAVFTLVNPPSLTPLATNPKPVIDDPVYAVGNALGDGVVIRDGLLTSMTPEDQDGRWKWLRFSAAASPGNSGGPLLDAQGNVTGIVIARSSGENLNYALPIENVLDDAGKTVGIDVRASFSSPLFAGAEVALWKDSFPLPLTYAEFSKRLLASRLAYDEAQRRQLLTSHLAETFPRGESAKLLAQSDPMQRPTLVAQSGDHIWEASDGESEDEFDLPNGGKVSVRYFRGVGLFVLKRGNEASDDGFYSDSRAFADVLLKAAKLSRPVGSQAIRVTSMGSASQEVPLVDRFGRKWQMRTWPVGFLDFELVTLALPTPEGYVGMLRFSATSEHAVTASEYAPLADYFQATYGGTLKQWQAFMKRDGRQPPFERLKLEVSPTTGVKFASPRFETAVSNSLFSLSDTTWLQLNTVLMEDDGKVALDVGKFFVAPDQKSETYIVAKRQAKPGSGAGKEPQDRWENMLKRTGDFSGASGHDEDFKTFWVRNSVGATRAGSTVIDGSSRVLYELVYRTRDRVSPADFESRRQEMTRAFRILEH